MGVEKPFPSSYKPIPHISEPSNYSASPPNDWFTDALSTGLGICEIPCVAAYIQYRAVCIQPIIGYDESK